MRLNQTRTYPDVQKVRKGHVTLRVRALIRPVTMAVVGLLAVLAVAGCSVASAHRPSSAAQTSSGTTAAHRRSAVRDAMHLLAGVMPPSGAALLERRSAIGVQRRIPLITASFASALDSERWSVPERPSAVLSYVVSHLPPGSKLVSKGSSGPNPVTQSVIRSWAPVGGVLDTRFLSIEVTGHASGRTLLAAESQSQWVIVRPAQERVPAAVTEVKITDGLPGHPPRLTRIVTARRTVRRLLELFNGLGIVQPGSINCPAVPTAEPVVTVTFRAAAAARALASASVNPGANFSWPDSVPGWACFPITFSAEGHRYRPLIGNVISPIDRLLHVRLQSTA
jgi:hypothetical protein